MPLSLKKVERDIIKELEKENLQVYFRMKNLTPQGFVEYDLAPENSEARRIIENHLSKWRREIFAFFFIQVNFNCGLGLHKKRGDCAGDIATTV